MSSWRRELLERIAIRLLLPPPAEASAQSELLAIRLAEACARPRSQLFVPTRARVRSANGTVYILKIHADPHPTEPDCVIVRGTLRQRFRVFWLIDQVVLDKDGVIQSACPVSTHQA